MSYYVPDEKSWPSEGSSARNKEEIAQVLKPWLSSGSQKVFEVASGFGEHALTIAKAYPNVIMTPTEAQDVLVEKMVQKFISQQLINITTPFLFNLDNDIDVASFLEQRSNVDQALYTGVLAINLIHISPKRIIEKLFAFAEAILLKGSTPETPKWVALYGAYKKNATQFYSESDKRFEESLKQRNDEWGLRHLETEVIPIAAAHGFITPPQVFQMNKGNFTIVFTRD
ncbi:uncharacterized protein SAPINGB_P002269 [Magnusiomyces paraingens]|uniref:Methyltransferase domain-containing protein n=1 Tax=Magnusiomyces paraingens TaxID=2606893 RepID=A0A5E8BEE6_9ASCO|nr:uncharacterized protein SAPINGB_P002269 [Saprochaete ingens]VVT49437.1 unnamed protein product [Saprochaete ingens]